MKKKEKLKMILQKRDNIINPQIFSLFNNNSIQVNKLKNIKSKNKSKKFLTY